MRFLLMAALLGLVLGAPARAQTTPNIACTHAGNNSAAFTRSNECDDKLDNAMNSALAIATGDANVTLTAAQQNEEGLLEFTGALTADRDVTLLAGQERRLTVYNNTTGAFDLVFKYATGATVSVRSGEIVDIHADGTDVLRRGLPDVPSIGTISTFDGTNDKFLVWDNDVNAYRAVTADDMPGSGVSGGGTAVTAGAWELIDTQTASASANIDLLFDDTLYDEIRVSFFDVLPATDGVELWVRVSVASSFITTSTYVFDLHQQSAADSIDYANSKVGANTDIKIKASIGPLSSTATEVAAGDLVLKSPGSSNIKVLYGRTAFVDTTPDSRGQIYHGYNTTTSAIDGLRFLMSSGNISAGTFQLWGLRKDANTVNSLQTTDATVTDAFAHVLASGESVTIRAMVHGLKSTGEVYSAQILNTCRNNGGTMEEGTDVLDEIELGALTGSVLAEINDDNTAKSCDVQVTGATSETWDWTVKVERIYQ